MSLLHLSTHSHLFSTLLIVVSLCVNNCNKKLLSPRLEQQKSMDIQKYLEVSLETVPLIRATSIDVHLVPMTSLGHGFNHVYTTALVCNLSCGARLKGNHGSSWPTP